MRRLVVVSLIVRNLFLGFVHIVRDLLVSFLDSRFIDIVAVGWSCRTLLKIIGCACCTGLVTAQDVSLQRVPQDEQS